MEPKKEDSEITHLHHLHLSTCICQDLEKKGSNSFDLRLNNQPVDTSIYLQRLEAGASPCSLADTTLRIKNSTHQTTEFANRSLTDMQRWHIKTSLRSLILLTYSLVTCALLMYYVFAMYGLERRIAHMEKLLTQNNTNYKYSVPDHDLNSLKSLLSEEINKVGNQCTYYFLSKAAKI